MGKMAESKNSVLSSNLEKLTLKKFSLEVYHMPTK